MRAYAASIALAIGLLSGRADAAFVEVPYTQQAISWNEQLDAIADILALTERESLGARKVAAGWLYAGPCRGRADASGDGAGALTLVLGADGDNNFEVAILAMIGVLQRHDLGRSPSEAACRFAEETR